MGKGAMHLMCAEIGLTDEEYRMLNGRVAELKRIDPNTKVDMESFLNMALRVGIDIELDAIREDAEKRC